MVGLAALDRKVLRDLWKSRGQLLAIALVMACGISMFVSQLSTLDSLRDAMHAYYARHRFADVFAGLVRAPEGMLREIRELPGVLEAEGRVVAQVTLDVRGMKEAVTGLLVSIPDEGEPPMNGLHLRRGRLPAPRDSREVVVSEAFAGAHGLGRNDEIRAVLNGRLERLRVVGIALSPEYVYSIQPGGVYPDDRRFGVMWMRREGLARAFDMDGAFNDLVVRLTDPAREEDVIAAVDRRLERFGGLGAYGRRDQVSNWYLENELAQLRGTGLVMPIVFLLVAAFLLNVVLTRQVQLQRDQIAVLKAFGYDNLGVGVHYGKQVVIIVLVSGLLGIAGGAWMGQGMVGMYGDFFRFPSLPYRLGGHWFVLALLIAGVSALLGTLRAIHTAVRLPPAEAMRPEAPAIYRATLVERLGIQHLLNGGTRMVLRRLERRPTKSLLTVVGIASSIALLVVGWFFRDAIEFAIDEQFGRMQREDLAITLVEPRSTRALHELSRLPGAERAEPERAVAARLRAGHRSRRVAVVGFAPGATLRQLVDVEGRVVDLPADGLVLTRTLAERLDVTTGDRVILEALEGVRPRREVMVSRVVEAYIGLGAYMDLQALNRTMEEPSPTITGAQLRVDPRSLDVLHARIKATPGIAAVAARDAMRESFEETAAGTMTLFSFFMIVFASVIACGVVYNSARVSLAEQARELASLRVLGFRRREVSMIFLGELWVLTALAVPVGLLMGNGLARLLAPTLETELYRIPFLIRPSTYGVAALTTTIASVLAGLVVRRRIDRLDLVEALKTRE